MTEINILNSDEKFFVNNIFCIGKNYADHIQEMQGNNKNTEIPMEPVVFLKPNTAIVSDNSNCSVPVFNGKKVSNSLQNEVELVIAIGKDGDKIKLENANEFIFGYAVGIDLTLRDIQSQLKSKGLPWTKSKGFIGSAPVSDIVKKENIKDPANLKIYLKVNNEFRQNSVTSGMIFKADYLVYYISHMYGIRKGDIIFTGTPSGVSDLHSGDFVEAEIENIGNLKVNIL